MYKNAFAKKIGRRKHTKMNAAFIVVFVLFCIYSATLIYAYAWAFMTTFKFNNDYYSDRVGLPSVWTFSNYINAFIELQASDKSLFTMILNSLWFSLGGSFIAMCSSSVCAYVVAKYKFWGRNIIYSVVLVTMALPIVGALPSQYTMYSALGILDTPLLLITNLNGLNFNFIVLFGFFKSLPWDYAEAAFLDGVENHNEKYSSHGLEFIINLYPVNFYDQASGNTSASYLEYVMQYCSTVLSGLNDGLKFLSADHYPLCYSTEADGSVEYYLEPEWLITVETIAEYAKMYDAFPHFYLLSRGHYGKYRDATEERLRYQANVYMTYGAKGLTHFTSHGDGDEDNGTVYPSFTDAMISRSGTETRQTYEYAKTVNLEILSWDHVFLRYDWQGVRYVLGEGNGSNALFAATQFGLSSLPGVENVFSSEDLIVGHFTDANGQPAYMVTNFCDPDRSTTEDAAEVNMTITDANCAIIYRNGVPETVQIEDGALSFTVGVGEAAFVIPFHLSGK